MFGSKGGGVAVSLNGNPLPRVDVAENGLRERQHCPWREEFFKLIAILPRQTFGEVLEASGSHLNNKQLVDGSSYDVEGNLGSGEFGFGVTS